MKEHRGRRKSKHFGKGPAIFSPAVPSAIYTPLEFDHLLGMECARADRYGSRFSIALFEVGTSNENSVLIRRIVRTLHHRFRNTDDVGWYSRRQIGVIMPFTPREGAWKLAEYVCSVISAVTEPPAFAIFSYPSSHWPHKSLLQRLLHRLAPSNLLAAWPGARASGASEFHAYVARERGRADRNSNIFSLIVFDLGSEPPSAIRVRRLIIALTQRLRDTDEIGWFDRRRLGALLPYVSMADASRIASSICKVAGLAEAESVRVHTYPDSWFPPQSPLSDRADRPGQPPGSDGAGESETPSGMTAGNELLHPPIPAWKRVIDMTFALPALLLLSPLMALAAVIVRLGSPGPILFRQERVGYAGRTFELLKFRTMKTGTNTSGHSQYLRKLIVEDSESKPMEKQENNPDIIPGGRWLRKSCLDETPQLFNVLKGEMSLVGPRPCIPYEAREYLRWHARRFDSLPGMTGLWQVSGKNRTTFKEMIRFDIKYEQNRSPWLDLSILLRTPWAIVKQATEGSKAPAREEAKAST